MAGEPVPLKFNPQVVKDSTRRAGEMSYFDCGNVRFVNGFPQSIGGWSKISNNAVNGTARAMFCWSDLDGSNLMSVGTNLKYYIEDGGEFEDITPIRASSTINTDPFTTSTGLSTVVVTDTSHGASADDFVTFSGATGPIGGIDAADFNAEHQVVSVTDANTYVIDVGTVAGSTASGGGAAVVAAYQITTGLDTTVLGGGWGAGSFSRGTWGSGVSTTIEGSQLRLWSQDNFGEDLVFNPRGGGLYYKDISAGAGRAVLISSLGSANEVPVVADQILVATEERTLMAFGCNPIGSSTADPLMVRWGDRESLIEWEPTDATTAGGFRVSIGSQHMLAVKTRQGIAHFTDKALYLIQFLGTSGFVPRLISDKVFILGPRSAIALDGTLYWMAIRGLFSWSGTVSELPSGMTQYIYNRMNRDQTWKAHVGINPHFNEVWFFYVSTDSEEVDSYVIYNVKDKTWVPGMMGRTAWVEAGGSYRKPRAVDADGYVYEHESGLNDGSTNPPSALGSYIETNLFTLGNGKHQHRIRTMWPDINFDGSTAASPEVTMSLRLQDKMGSADNLIEIGSTVRTVTVPVEEFTDKIDIGKRARFMSLRISCDTTDTAWQLGVPHLDLIQDGQR